MNKNAACVGFITGITGQDGSYLAEILLDKGYDVWGMIRRSSSINTSRIEHIFNHLILRYGDMTDGTSMFNILNEIKNTYPNLQRLEIFSLAAQSHVKISFEMPEYTANTDAIGTLKLLEAIKELKFGDTVKFYQASTSELYGKVLEIPQTEKTPFNPQSPYAIAKLYSYWIVKNYRDSYNMFACNGLLYNHESLASFMPLLFKQNNIVDIKPISEIVKYHTRKGEIATNENKKCYQEVEPNKELYVWDDNDWTKVKFASGFPHDVKANNKKPKFVISKNAAYFTTDSHVIIMDDDSEKEAKDIKIGDDVKLIKFDNVDTQNSQKFEFNYKHNNNTFECLYCNYVVSKKQYEEHVETCKQKLDFMKNDVDEDEAELLGLMVGDGYVEGNAQFTNKDDQLIDHVKNLWEKICKRNNKIAGHKIRQTTSGFTGEQDIYQLNLTGFNDFFRKYSIYNEDKTKRVPYQILNTSPNIQLKFLTGYNAADGLKAGRCKYLFKNFKTNSATLAQGLIYLISKTTKQGFNINVEFVHKFDRDNLYYSINLSSNSKRSQQKNMEKYEIIKEKFGQGMPKREISRTTGISRKFIQDVLNKDYKPENKHHNSIPENKVKKIIEYHDYDGWFYDLETESGKFHAGLGLGRIHNSPRRGHNFVTRKITIGLGKILRGEENKLVMGNINAKRDWGHAKDYCYGMWKILQQDKPDDYVIATGENYTVREFIEKAFALKGFNILWKGTGVDEIGYDSDTGRELIFISPKYFRPTEVDELLGDATKAKNDLGWKPTIDFDELVKEMVENDCK